MFKRPQPRGMLDVMVAKSGGQAAGIICKFPKIGATLVGVPIIRIIVFGGLCWAPFWEITVYVPVPDLNQWSSSAIRRERRVPQT